MAAARGLDVIVIVLLAESMVLLVNVCADEVSATLFLYTTVTPSPGERASMLVAVLSAAIPVLGRFNRTTGLTPVEIVRPGLPLRVAVVILMGLTVPVVRLVMVALTAVILLKLSSGGFVWLAIFVSQQDPVLALMLY